MTEDDLDDLLGELRRELSATPSPAFAAGVLRRIAAASGGRLPVAAGIAASLALVALVVLPSMDVPEAVPAMPDVPRVSRVAPLTAVPTAAPLGPFTPEPARPSPAGRTAGRHARVASSPLPATGPPPRDDSGLPAFESGGVWVPTSTPSWTEATFATVDPVPLQWTTIDASIEIQPVQFPTFEFPNVAMMPIARPVIGGETPR